MSNLFGRANLREKNRAERERWLKVPGEEKPCHIANCDQEGMYVPILTIYGRDDPNRTKQFVKVILPIYMCAGHATTDPKEFVPDDNTVQDVIVRLGLTKEGTQRDPDFDNMIVQYFGNAKVKPELSMNAAKGASGAYRPEYDPESGKVETKKVV